MNSAQVKSVDHLLTLIRKKLDGNNKYKNLKEHGPLEINGFSITFWVNFDGDFGKSSLYVKIPKIIWGNRNVNFNTPITESDRVLARNEFDSLIYLSANWSEKSGVSFIKPLGYIEEYNAILTERIFGKFFFKSFMNEDFQRRLSKRKTGKVEEGLFKFGKSLREFHLREIDEIIFDSNKVIKKPLNYLEILKEHKLDQAGLEYLSRRLNEYQDTEYSTSIVNNFKGIDVRQILTDSDNCIYVMDPGKITRSYIEVDLARFIVTCRILYWGTFWILLKLFPDSRYEKSFMSGYNGTDTFSKEVLNIMILKEILKHWKMAHQSLEKKQWPMLIKIFLRRFYINSFYMLLFKNQICQLEKESL